jgi:hypothetical protein
MGDELQNFLQSLTTERPANIGRKEQELVKIRERIRKIRAKGGKQRQRMREKMAVLRESADELAFLKVQAARVRAEIVAFADDVTD